MIISEMIFPKKQKRKGRDCKFPPFAKRECGVHRANSRPAPPSPDRTGSRPAPPRHRAQRTGLDWFPKDWFHRAQRTGSQRTRHRATAPKGLVPGQDWFPASANSRPAPPRPKEPGRPHHSKRVRNKEKETREFTLKTSSSIFFKGNQKDVYIQYKREGIFRAQ